MRFLGQWSTNTFKLAVFRKVWTNILIRPFITQFSEGKVDSTWFSKKDLLDHRVMSYLFFHESDHNFAYLVSYADKLAGDKYRRICKRPFPTQKWKWPKPGTAKGTVCRSHVNVAVCVYFIPLCRVKRRQGWVSLLQSCSLFLSTLQSRLGKS